MPPWLAQLARGPWLGNTAEAYALALLILLGVAFGARLLHHRLVARLKSWAGRSDGDLDDLLARLLEGLTRLDFAVLGLYFAGRSLTLNPAAAKGLQILLVVVLSWRAALWIQELIGFGVRRLTREAGLVDAHASAAVRNLQYLVNGVVWACAALFVLDNLGVDITAMVAGLGVGGIAVAMAAQSIFKDLFSSFVIFMDQPFKVGDFIVVGNMSGTVEFVGIKTSRIRSLSGELLVLSNSDLTTSPIRNYKQMAQRRVELRFGVTYQTPREKLARIPAMIREIFAGLKQTRLDRAHFHGFGDSALEFEVVYFVLSSDYLVHMERRQELNLALMERFEREGIAFAYPTQTIKLER